MGVIVVGLPRRLDGTDTDRTQHARVFAETIQQRTGIRVVLQDERLTSVEAESRLALRERDWRVRKATLDAAAAAVVLQDYLDSQPSAGIVRLGGGRVNPVPPPPGPPTAPGVPAGSRARRRWWLLIPVLLLTGLVALAGLRVRSTPARRDAVRGLRRSGGVRRDPPGRGRDRDRTGPGREPAWSGTRRRSGWPCGSSEAGRLLKAGEYQFAGPLTAEQVVSRLVRGEVVLRTITFPEGLTFREMGRLFESRGFGPASAFVDAARNGGARLRPGSRARGPRRLPVPGNLLVAAGRDRCRPRGDDGESVPAGSHADLQRPLGRLASTA